MTPNETLSMSVLTGLDDSRSSTTSDLMGKSNGHFSTPPPIKSASHVLHQKSVFNYSDDDQMAMMIDPSPHTIGRMKRMKSLGNLPLFQRDFGGTPQDIVRMRRDFEAHRFGMARMKSMTDLMEIPDDDQSHVCSRHSSNRDEMEDQQYQQRYPKAIARDSIFKRNHTSSMNSKQRIGVGDTKFIGSDLDRSGLMQHPGRRLSKNKSMGMIPDLIAERRYDLMTPPMLKDSGEEEQPDSDEDEGLGENLLDVTSYEHFDVILRNRRGCYQVSEPGGQRSPEEMFRPFERGYRRSYMKMSSQSPQQQQALSPQMIMRQSDGWFSTGGAGAAAPGQWTKMYRYQRQESVEERLIPVFAYDRNNNTNKQKPHTAAYSSPGAGSDVVDGSVMRKMVQQEQRQSNASSCCIVSGSSTSSRVQVVQKILKHRQSSSASSQWLQPTTTTTPPKRCVSAEPIGGGAALRGRNSVERYARAGEWGETLFCCCCRQHAHCDCLLSRRRISLSLSLYLSPLVAILDARLWFY